MCVWDRDINTMNNNNNNGMNYKCFIFKNQLWELCDFFMYAIEIYLTEDTEMGHDVKETYQIDS